MKHSMFKFGLGGESIEVGPATWPLLSVPSEESSCLAAPSSPLACGLAPDHSCASDPTVSSSLSLFPLFPRLRGVWLTSLHYALTTQPEVTS